MSLPPFGVTKLADICVACFQSGFFNHEYPPAQPLRENPAHLSKLKWLLWICIHQRRESNERSKQQPSNKLSAKRPSSSSGHGDNQPSVGAAQWAGLGGSALCYIHQTQLLMTIGAGLLSAGGLCSEQRSLRQLCHKHLVCHHQSPAQTALDLGYTSYFMFEPIPLTVSFMQTTH